jgi:hypothetical protein
MMCSEFGGCTNFLALRCGIPCNWNVVRLLVRLEGLRTKPVRGAVVLDLVAGNAGATGRHFREPMFITAYPTETGLGGADPQRATALRLLAPWFLGMDGRSGSIRISLRRCLLNTATEHITLGTHQA